MRRHSAQTTTALIEAALRGTLTEAQARRLYAAGPEAVVRFSLAVVCRAAHSVADGCNGANGPAVGSSKMFPK